MEVKEFDFISNMTQNKFSYYKRNDGVFQKISSNNLNVKEIQDMQEKKKVFWLDVFNPTTKEILLLTELFSIHPLTAEDIQVRDGREKCERYSLYFFFCIKTVYQKNTKDLFFDEDLPTIYIIMFDNHILTIHYEDMSYRQSVIFKRLEIGLGGGRVRVLGPGTENGFTSAWIMYCLFDDVVDEFIPYLDEIEAEVDSIEDLVIFLSGTDHKEMLKRIGYSKKRITSLIRLIKPKKDIVTFLLTRCSEKFNEVDLYVRDIQDHIYTMLTELEHGNETMNTCHSSYIALISMEMTDFSNKMAVIAKNMNVFAIILFPFTLITGLWGMNVPVPGEKGMGLSDCTGFIVLCLLMLLITFFVYLLASKKHLL